MSAVVAVVENNGNILIGKKVSGNHFLSGKWHIPGGKVKPDESDEQALKREMKEECGIDVKVERFIEEFYEPSAKMHAKWYLCSCEKCDTNAGGDLTDVKWVGKNVVEEVCDRKAVERWPDKIKKFFTTKAP